MLKLIQKIQKARRIFLSTHKNADGDGLGSEIALYHALKSQAKEVHIIQYEPLSPRYHFLTQNILMLTSPHELSHHRPTSDDLVLIFDTHDPKLCQPLFDQLHTLQIPLFFIDHHVPFQIESQWIQYLINEKASCTGEIVFDLIQQMNIPISAEIATALYTSLIFDTQNFKLIRKSARPFEMAADLIKAKANHELVQYQLFNNWSVQKMKFLSNLIDRIDYKNDNKIAIIKMSQQDLSVHQLKNDDVSDLIDFFMMIQKIELAIVLREESLNHYKMSFRGRTQEVLSWAHAFGGGGHRFSSGAWVHDTEKNILQKLNQLCLENFTSI